MAARFGDRGAREVAARRRGRTGERERRLQKRISALERELDGDRRRHGRMLEQYEELRLDLEELKSDIHRRERLLETLRESASGFATRARRAAPPPNKPQIAERILWGNLEPMFPRQVRDAAVKRGWLPEDPASHNQLSVAMSKLVRKGRLVKGADGRYSLPQGRAMPG
jgi:hypothetical protein